jgi:hypothetical protein
MAATVDLALALALQIALSPAPDAEPVCPGPRVAEVEAQIGAGQRFAFTGPMTAPFLQLWMQGQRPALPVEPDNITVLAEPGLPLLILYGRRGCALGVLRASRPDLFQAMRSSIGPAV